MTKNSKGLISSILSANCPECRQGSISDGFFGMKKKCPNCGYNLNPESGYFLGAMMVAFFITSFLTIPPMVYLKFTGADDRLLIAYPFIQYAIIGPVLIYYAKIIWVYVGHRADQKMNKK